MIIQGLPDSIPRAAYHQLFAALGLQDAVVHSVRLGPASIEVAVWAYRPDGDPIPTVEAAAGTALHRVTIPVVDEDRAQPDLTWS